MKQIIALIILLVPGGVMYSQNGCQPPTFYFDSMSTVSGTGGLGSVYRFTNVLSGVDARVTITRIQNAFTSNSDMDVTGNYALAWQPYITFPAARTNLTDTSYLEFHIEFGGNSGPFSRINQNCMAMTIVDCDGPGVTNSFREMVKVSLPGFPKGVLNSTISVFQDSRWILYKSGLANFPNIDTTTVDAMGQTNFPDTVNHFYMRVGVVGPVGANVQRQFSFYFQSFSGLTVPLPVKVINYRSSLVNRDGWVSWMTSDEVNMDRYEVYRSFNGKDFLLAGSVKANKSQLISEYMFVDIGIKDYQQQKVYYKLKMIDQQELASWGDISMLNMNAGSVSELAGIFPNPAVESITIDLGNDAGSGYDVQVLDIYGKSVLRVINPEFNGTLFTLDINKLNKGLYFINLNHMNGSSFMNRFIKY